MLDSKQTIKYYQALSKICHHLLYGDNNLLIGNREKLRESFVENIFRTIQTSLEITLDKEALDNFIEDKNREPSPEELNAFLSQYIENIETYTLINRYLLEFITICAKYMPRTKRNQLDKLFSKHNLEISDLENIEKSLIYVLSQLHEILSRCAIQTKNPIP